VAKAIRTLTFALERSFHGIHASRSGETVELDCARTVHESSVLIALVFALSEKQIPQIVENGKPKR